MQIDSIYGILLITTKVNFNFSLFFLKKQKNKKTLGYGEALTMEVNRASKYPLFQQYSHNT